MLPGPGVGLNFLHFNAGVYSGVSFFLALVVLLGMLGLIYQLS